MYGHATLSLYGKHVGKAAPFGSILALFSLPGKVKCTYTWTKEKPKQTIKAKEQNKSNQEGKLNKNKFFWIAFWLIFYDKEQLYFYKPCWKLNMNLDTEYLSSFALHFAL